MREQLHGRTCFTAGLFSLIHIHIQVHDLGYHASVLFICTVYSFSTPTSPLPTLVETAAPRSLWQTRQTMTPQMTTQ